MELAEPRVVVADERDADAVREAGFDGPLLTDPGRVALRRRSGAGGGSRAGRPGADHVHLGHRRRAQADPPRPALPDRPARAGRALVRRAPGRPGLVHRRLGLVEVGAQRLHRPVAHGCDGAAARRPLRPRGAPRRRRARGRERALHGADRVPGRSRSGPSCASSPPAARVAAGEPLNPEDRPRSGATGSGWRSTTAMGRPRPARSPGCRSGRRSGPARWAAAPRLQALDRRRRAVRRPGDGAHLLPRRPAGRLAHRRPRPPGRGRLPLVRGPHRRRDHLLRLPDRPVRGGVGARLAPGRRRGGRGGGTRRGARLGRARGGRAARGPRRRATRSRASCRSTSRPRRRPTSTRASSSSPTSCRRRRAARSSARSCAGERGPCEILLVPSWTEIQWARQPRSRSGPTWPATTRRRRRRAPPRGGRAARSVAPEERRRSSAGLDDCIVVGDDFGVGLRHLDRGGSAACRGLR